MKGEFNELVVYSHMVILVEVQIKMNCYNSPSSIYFKKYS